MIASPGTSPPPSPFPQPCLLDVAPTSSGWFDPPTISAIAAVFSAVAVYAALSVSRALARRQLFELARSLHQDLTTGDVQTARNILGTVRRNKNARVALPEVVDAYFRLLWCFERINAGRDIMKPGLGARLVFRVINGAERHTPRAYLDELIRWHIKEWHEAFSTQKSHSRGLRNDIDGALRTADPASNGLDDGESIKAFDALVLELSKPKASLTRARGNH